MLNIIRINSYGTLPIASKYTDIVLIHDHVPLLEYQDFHIEKMIAGASALDRYYTTCTNSIFVFNDYICFDHGYDVKTLCLGKEFILDLKEHLPLAVSTILSNKVPTKNLTFLSNQKRPHRGLTSMWIANNMDINDIMYSSRDYDTVYLEEHLLNKNYDLAPKITLPESFLFTNESQFDDGNRVIYHDTIDNIGNFINISDMYTDSVLSIVAETSSYEPGFHPSEKTIHAWLSGHMVIWPGGWRCAEIFTKLGFDVFDDVLDHSYQYIRDPVDRTLMALELNRDFIKSIGVQSDFYNDNLTRFQHNIDTLTDIVAIESKILELNDSDVLKQYYKTINT